MGRGIDSPTLGVLDERFPLTRLGPASESLGRSGALPLGMSEDTRSRIGEGAESEGRDVGAADSALCNSPVGCGDNELEPSFDLFPKLPIFEVMLLDDRLRSGDRLCP
jgi:hypothetical protein